MTRSDWWAVTVFGFTGYYLASFLDFLGLQYISAGLERLILFLYPTMVVLISAIWFRQRIGRRVIVALVLSYLGIAFAYVHDMQIQTEGLLLGAGLVFASALAYAIYLIGAGHTIARIGATRFTAYAMTVACIAALLQFVVMNPMSDLDPPSSWRRRSVVSVRCGPRSSGLSARSRPSTWPTLSWERPSP
jgi:drug/metabolite transporter (DMT)-like permease